MKLLTFIGRDFWLVIGSAVIVALLFPGLNETLTPYLMPNLRYMVMAMLFMVFIRVDLVEMLRYLKNPRFLGYVSLSFLVIIPILLYYLTKPFGDDIATAVLIISAMPTGASAGTLARLIGGNATLGASMTVVTSLLAPLTVPSVLGLLTGTSVDINRLSLLISLATTLFIPMLASQFVLRWIKPAAAYIKPRAPSLNILILFFVTYAPIAANRNLLLDEPSALLAQTIILFIVFIILHIIGYFIAPQKSKGDRLALATSRAYMNLGLAVLVAVTYYGPEVLVAVVLAHLPWSLLLKPFKSVAQRV